jgi:hypothetical protein
MPKPRPSMLKRQREQAKREKSAAKAEKRANRTTNDTSDIDMSELVRETPEH